jgi:hypothetical protein
VESQRRRRGRNDAACRFYHSEVGHDTVQRRTRDVARGVPHTLPVEESALCREQLREKRAHDPKQDHAYQQFDECEAAADAAMTIVSHAQVVQRALLVLAFVRVKLSVSGLYFALVGVMTTFTVLTVLATVSATVIKRVWGYGAAEILTLDVPTVTESYGRPSRRFTSFMRTPFLYALPVAIIPLLDIEVRRAASEVTATASSTIATMTSTITNPFRRFVALSFIPCVGLSGFRNEIFIIF